MKKMMQSLKHPARKYEKLGWNVYYQRLVDFYRVHGHSNVPQRYPQDPSLGTWVGRQRSSRCRKNLAEDRRKKLSEVEFSWELQDERFDRLWNESYEELKEYKARHGNCEVPKLYRSDRPRSLGSWVSMQKKNYHQGTLREDRMRMLNALGFKWEKKETHLWRPGRDVEALEAIWLENYDKLVDFCRTYGHTLVPNLFVDGRAESLGRWVRAQRSSYLQKTLPGHRKKLLEEIGFVWVVRRMEEGHPAWYELYARLLEYRSAHGDCQVPINYSQDAELARWVAEQRSRLKNGSIAPFRIERLDAIGFSMTKDDFTTYWNKQYKNLVAYQTKHKTSRICHTSEGRLLRWTGAQRFLYRCGLLSTEQKEMLQSIGFDWSMASPAANNSTTFSDDEWGMPSDDSSSESADSLCLGSRAEASAPDEKECSPRKKRKRSFESNCHADGRVACDPTRQGIESSTSKLLIVSPSTNRTTYSDVTPRHMSSVTPDDFSFENLGGKGEYEPDERTPDHVELHGDQPDPLPESSFHSTKRSPESAENLCSSDELADEVGRERVPCSFLHPIGTRVRKHYGGYGWVSGQIAQFEGVYRVRYEDGDEEDFLNHDTELAAIVSQANVNQKGAPVSGSMFPIGTQVYKFFDGYGWFYGNIIAFDGVYLIRHDDGDEEELFYDSPEVAKIVANARRR